MNQSQLGTKRRDHFTLAEKGNQMSRLRLREPHSGRENKPKMTGKFRVKTHRIFLSKSIYFSVACSIVMTVFSESAGTAETLLHVDLEGAAMSENQKPGPAPGHVVIHQPGHDLTASIDPGTPYSVWRTSEPGRPTPSLAIRIDPEHRPPDEVQKSKFEINVIRQDDRALDAAHDGHYVLKNGSSNYLGFAIKLDRDFYDSPQKWVLHFQVWQCCSLKTLPPLVFQAIPRLSSTGDSVPFAMIARNDDYIADRPHSDFGRHLSFTNGTEILPLERDRWYSMVLFLKPDPGTRRDGTLQSSSGQVDLWVDGRQALHYTGPWGYTPDAGSGVEGTYAVKLGIYRAAQPTRQQVYFNNIRWGTDRASVDPDARR